MYDIADDNLRRDGFENNSDEECQILEEKLVKPPAVGEADYIYPMIRSIIRASVISERKRPATDSQSNPREATGFKQPALQVTDGEVQRPTPVPTTSQGLVQSSILTAGHLSMPVQSNQPHPQVPGCSMYQSHSSSMQQPIPSCNSIPFIGPPCAHKSSVSSCHFPMCNCNSLARPIPMRPPGLISSYYPAQSSNSGQISMNNGLDSNPSQPSPPPQQLHDSSTLSSHSLNQHFLSCASPFVSNLHVQASNLPNPVITSSSSAIPVNSSSSPQINHPEDTIDGTYSSVQEFIESMARGSQKNISETIDNSPINVGQAALDLSSPPHGQSSSNPATVMENHPIWQGTLHYEEKGLNLSDPNVSHYLGCTFVMKTRGDSDLSINLWPNQMLLSLIASEILKEKNMLEVLKSAAHHVVINFHEESQVLKRIKRNMHHGWMGCIQFTIPNDVRIMIVLYMPQKKVFVGFIPHEQKVFFNTFRHVYEKKRRLRNIRKQLEADMPLSGGQPASSSVSSVMGSSEQSRNQFEDIDNEINAHISALRKHEEAQPSTYQQPGASHSASNQSIEARLKRLEAAQNGNTQNVNEYEEIDNEINRQIAAHWLRHNSPVEAPSSTAQQTNVGCPLPNISYTSPSSALPQTSASLLNTIPSSQWLVREMNTVENVLKKWQVAPIVPPSTFKQYYLPGQPAGTIHVGGTQTTNVGTQSSQGASASGDENSAAAQASEIFGKDLVQKVVRKKLAETGKRFYTVEELCDEILKHEETRPKPVGERSKKEVSEELLCKICLDQRLSIVFEPCGHLATCQECSQSLTKCPMCRTVVRKKMRIYM